MRILSRKIWRAFPELDQFDDEACARYIRRVWGQRNIWKFWLILIALLPISLILWLAIMLATIFFFDLSTYPTTSEIVNLMQIGFAGMPLITMLLARDFWLHRQIQKQIDGAGCKECEYCLVGLEIKESKTDDYVLCPECGDQNFLDGVRLAREDIDPTLIPSS